MEIALSFVVLAVMDCPIRTHSFVNKIPLHIIPHDFLRKFITPIVAPFNFQTFISNHVIYSIRISCGFLFDLCYILWYDIYVIGICDIPSGYTRCLGLYEVRVYKVRGTLCFLAFLFAGICTLAGMIQDTNPVSVLFLPFYFRKKEVMEISRSTNQ